MITLINALVGLGTICAIDASRNYEPWETDSILEVMPHQEHHPYVFVGTSHVGAFALCQANIQAVERATGARVPIIARAASGVFQHRLFLQEYFDRGNTVDTVVYFVDPWCFFSRSWNEEMKYIEIEPLDRSFLMSMIREGVPLERIRAYARTKTSYTWFRKPPFPPRDCNQTVAEVDPELVAKRWKALYLDGESDAILDRYVRELFAMAEDLKARGTDVLLVIPPTLLGPPRGLPRLWPTLHACQSRYDIQTIDLSQAMSDPVLYSDLDHLNHSGIVALLNQHLLPALQSLDTLNE